MASEVFRNDETGQLGRFHLIRGEQRFIPNDPAADPAAGVGALEAGVIAAGSFADPSQLGARFGAVFGDEDDQATVSESEALLGSLREAHPIATAVGETVPSLIFPGGKIAQTVVGGVEGALLNTENPFLGAAVGATGGLVGGAIGERLGRAVAARGTSAAARLAARNIPTSAAQRGVRGARVLETGLEAIPVLSTWVRAPARAQQRALNRGAGSVFGFEGKLTPKGLGEIKRGISKSFDQVERAIPDQQLPSELVDALDSAGVIDKATKDFMEGFGIVDGEALMKIRSNLNSDMADAFINANRKEGRQLRGLLTQVDDLITEQMPDALQQQWRTARQQWQFLTAIQKGKAISGTGDVNLASMNTALKQIYPNFRVGADLPGAAQGFGDLVQALDELPKALQSSGTAERGTAAALLLGSGVVAATEPSGLIAPVLAAATVVAQPGSRAGAATARAGGNLITEAIDDALADPEPAAQ